MRAHVWIRRGPATECAQCGIRTTWGGALEACGGRALAARDARRLRAVRIDSEGLRELARCAAACERTEPAYRLSPRLARARE